MKFTDLEKPDFLNDKHIIFTKIINAIERSHLKKSPNIFIKNIKLMEEVVDVIATRDEWPGCLTRALAFFESIEDYESCHRCKNLDQLIKLPIKKTRKNGKS